jgi:hypothetical protein
VADLAAVYDETRQRITAVVSALDVETLQRAVPGPDLFLKLDR